MTLPPKHNFYCTQLVLQTANYIFRLSTMTYVKALGEKDKVDDPTVPKYSTQWRWYYDEKCIEFGSVSGFS